MVLKKRLDSGSNGFNVLNVPRAPRSCRRKALCRRVDEDGQICAFDLLASLAGKLLQESESSSASTNAFEGDNHTAIGKEIKQEGHDECKLLKTECVDQGSLESKSTSDKSGGKCLLNEFPYFENDGILERTSFSGSLDNKSHYVKPIGCENKEVCNSPSKIGGFSGESCDVIVNSGIQQEAEGLGNGGLAADNACHFKDATKLHMAFPELINSDEDVKLPTSRDPVLDTSFNRNHTKLGIRDDDENFYRFYKFSNKFKSYRSPTRIGDRRIRKLLSSKYWKVGPKLKDLEYSRADGGLKPLYHKRKTCYNYARCQYQHDIAYKKRKISDRSSVVTSDGGFSSESVSNSPEKGHANGFAAMLHGANGLRSPVTSRHSKGSHVKFSIKSFKIPELFIEVPETTTVGSLKRTVVEAVTALLGGGICVGMLVEGKKVRDDNKTLSQTGISCKETLDTLGFTLEPGPERTPPTICSEDPLLSLPSDATNLPKRSPPTPTSDPGVPSSCPDAHALTNSSNAVENNLEIVTFQTDTTNEKPVSDSRALVPVPAVDVEALAIVPVNQKPKRSELAQRRTRRPFSVSEVEALVQAVEELGTGRWRDVKLRAFEDADHRTYVDLKDKWKTLVHTASIAPQQRRGEPVPQELLDRVLAAHGYWSQHQAKQHGKNHAGSPKITDATAADKERVGALPSPTVVTM